MTANAGLHVIAVDPAYTSQWGGERLGMLPLARDAGAGWFTRRCCGGRAADVAGI
jgi:hypothetical protein